MSPSVFKMLAPAVPAPSRETRCSAHGAIGESIVSAASGVQPQQPQQYSGFGLNHTSSGLDNLWGPLSKQSSSSSFWAGPPMDSDPVPESVSVSSSQSLYKNDGAEVPHYMSPKLYNVCALEIISWKCQENQMTREKEVSADIQHSKDVL